MGQLIRRYRRNPEPLEGCSLVFRRSVKKQVFSARADTRVSASNPDIQNEKLGEEGAGHKTANPSLGGAVWDSSNAFSRRRSLAGYAGAGLMARRIRPHKLSLFAARTTRRRPVARTLCHIIYIRPRGWAPNEDRKSLESNMSHTQVVANGEGEKAAECCRRLASLRVTEEIKSRYVAKRAVVCVDDERPSRSERIDSRSAGNGPRWTAGATSAWPPTIFKKVAP